MDIRPADGMLYAVTNAARIYTVNATTGAATLRSSLSADPADTTAPYMGLQGATYGVDFNSVVDRIRMVSNTGQNLRINVDLGTVITDPSLTTGTQATPTAHTNIGAVSYTQAFSSACRTAASLLDTTNGVFYSGNLLTGVLQPVASLGVTVGSTLSGYQVSTDNNGVDTAFALLRVNGTYNLYSVNLSTGAASNPVALGGLNAGETVTGLAMSIPTNQPAQAVGQMLGVSVSNRLISFNTLVPSKLCTSTAISGLQANDSLIGVDTRPADNQLYGIGTSGAIYTINKTTGAATQRATINGATLSGQNFGLQFNPIANAIRVVSDTNQNLVVNADTGATVTQTPLIPVNNSIVSSISYTNGFAGAGTIKAYVLDSANDRLLGLGLTSGSAGNGDLSTIGTPVPLGVGDIGRIGQIEINGVNNMAFAAVNVAQATTSQLVQVNLLTGTAMSSGTIGGNEAVRSIALTNVPTATTVAATAGNQLVSFNPTNPGTFTSSVALTGLQGGETVVGLEFRPSNGMLLGLTNAGRVYRVNATTGAATLMATAATTLTGTNFAPDFNPVVDQVRQLSDGQQNIVINVDTGSVTTQTSLNRAAFSVSAAAYINSVPGANAQTQTVLYDIDTVSNVLMIQQPQNNGTLMPVGPLGISVTGVNGFEITGGNAQGQSQAAYAALQTTGSTTSGLYNINLTTGAATLIGTIGVPNNSSILGLSAAPSTTAPVNNTPIFVVYSTNGTQTLGSFNFGTPGTLTSSNAITGLGAGETILGADFRPSNGVLYALTRNAVYSLNTANGQATLVATLTGTALNGTNFGVDVSPPADAIRVVSDNGQNVAVTFAGAVVTTGIAPLNMPTPSIFALGYTNSYAGALSTRAISIDSATSAVYQVNPTAAGTLVPIGGFSPGVTFTALGESDIAGGDDGLSLAALQPTGATQSTLYRVNPITGQITSIGAIGPTGTALVSAMAIQLQ